MRRRSFGVPQPKKLPSKRDLIQSLKLVYNSIAEPFTEYEYDKLCNQEYNSRFIAEVFGSFSEALEKAGLAKKFDKHQTIKEEKAKFDPEREIKKSWDEEKEKLLQRAESRRVKWLKDQTHKIDLLGDMIDEAIAKADPVTVEVYETPAKKQDSGKENVTLWFEFSDLQLGTLITKEEMGGVNEHNWLIWENKLNIWKKEVLDKINFYKRDFHIDHVVIACLGDMVEGIDIFKGQIWKVDRHVVDQAIMGANDTAACFAEIMLANSELKFDILEVFGNHGRIGRKGEVPYSCSMDKIYQRFLEAQLKSIPELKNYTYHHNEAWFYFLEIYGWTHLLLHGDQGMSKLWSGKPTVNSLEKGLVRFNQMLQQQVHFLHCGHFHSPVNFSFNISQILINGSFIGTSDFSATKMVASNPPVQLMYLFTPREGLTLTQRIYLTEESVKSPIQPKEL